MTSVVAAFATMASVRDFHSVGERRLRSCPGAHYDAVVFGVGPAACTFALQTVRLGRTALIVPPRNEATPNKPRGETLAPRGEFLLARLGIVKECLAGQHAAHMTLSCWQDPDPEPADLGFDPHGQMWHLNREAFDHALLTLAAASGAEIVDRTTHRVASLESYSDGWKVRIECSDHEHLISAGYLVDASGRSCFIARRLGCNRILQDHLAAVWCIRENPGRILPLLIEPVREGWWYSFGLPANMLLVAFITDPTLVNLSASSRRSVWNAALAQAPHTKCRVGAEAKHLGVASVESGRLNRMSGERWVAIGDAATSFDPLSSHGLCNALEQAIDAAELLHLSGHEADLTCFDTTRHNLYEAYSAQRLVFYRGVKRFSRDAFWRHRTLSPWGN